MKRTNLHPAPPRPELDELMRKARDHVMTPEEVFEQRVSFVYGNLAMSNPDVTREAVRERALAELPDKRRLQMTIGEDDGTHVKFVFGTGVLPGLGSSEGEDDWMEEFGW